MQKVFSLSIKGLLFFYNRPSDHQQLSRRGPPSDLHRLARLSQTRVERFDERIVLRRAQRRQIERFAQVGIPRIANGAALAGGA